MSETQIEITDHDALDISHKIYKKMIIFLNKEIMKLNVSDARKGQITLQVVDTVFMQVILSCSIKPLKQLDDTYLHLISYFKTMGITE